MWIVILFSLCIIVIDQTRFLGAIRSFKTFCLRSNASDMPLLICSLTTTSVGVSSRSDPLNARPAIMLSRRERLRICPSEDMSATSPASLLSAREMASHPNNVPVEVVLHLMGVTNVPRNESLNISSLSTYVVAWVSAPMDSQP